MKNMVFKFVLHLYKRSDLDTFSI